MSVNPVVVVWPIYVYAPPDVGELKIAYAVAPVTLFQVRRAPGDAETPVSPDGAPAGEVPDCGIDTTALGALA